ASRGIQAFRGLTGEVERTVCSGDGRRVAAVSRDWRVGVWDRPSGRLLLLADTPTGGSTDNAGIALFPDGKRLAYAAGREAVLWDIDTGRSVKRWALPEGYVDQLAFRGIRLLSFRVETSNPKVRPYGTNPANHPRVGRIRNLLG